MNNIKYLAAVLIGIAGLGLHQAKADSIGFDLSQGNPAISGYTGPYAHVQVTWVDSTHATVTFTSLFNGGNTYLMGDGGTVALQVNATTFNSSVAATNSFPGFAVPQVVGTGPGNEDGFGNFNLTVDLFDGYTNSANMVVVSLTNVSGTWASAANVLINNSHLTRAAAHIFVAAGAIPDPNASALATGYAGEGGAIVPDGGTTVMLLGTALGALGMARRFFRR